MAVALGLWTLAVAGFDWRQRRVPNWLLLLAFLPAIGWYGFFRTGLISVGWSAALVGVTVGVLFFLPGYWMRQVGAGDIKLAALTGGILGSAASIWAMLIASILLGLMAVAAKTTVDSGVTRRPLPAAIPIAIGFMVMLVLRMRELGALQ